MYKPDNRLTKTEALMKGLFEGIGNVLNGANCPHDKKRLGFALIVFDVNIGAKAGRMNYMSDCNREDMIAAMKEMIGQLEGRAHEAPAMKQ